MMLVDTSSYLQPVNVEINCMEDKNSSHCMETNSLIDELNESHQSREEETIEDSIDNITLLHPLFRPINISREGLRKQKTKSKTASMINRTVHRKKKTTE